MGITLTIIIIIATIGISYQAFNNLELKSAFLFRPYVIQEQKDWKRFLTSGFIHADFTHLLLNCYVLYIFGENIEYNFIYLFGPINGKIFFVLLYLTAIVTSSIPSYFKHKDNPGYASLGASGATSAIIFASIIFNPWQWFLFPPMPAILFGPAFLWYSSYMDKQNSDNIGHDAHFWGALYGLFFTLLLIFIKRPDFISQIISRLMTPSFNMF